MAHQYINRDFYEAVLKYNTDDSAQDYYYQVMDTETGRILPNGKKETVRDQILRVYAMLFCDDIAVPPGYIAKIQDVEDTADRLHTGNMGYDPKHWYRMQHHFPIIDEDNYDRFAALVISDLNAGELHDAAQNGYDMLLVGERGSLHMTADQRKHQKVKVVKYQLREDEL